MADQPKRRWRTRFSVRTFLILVTLACGYAACWWPTKTPGVHDIWSHRFHEEYKTWRQTYGFQPGVNAEAAFPPVISTIEMEPNASPPPRFSYHRRYYFWFFGYVVSLPFEREIHFL